MVAAGAVVEAGTTIPAGQIWGGNPAKFLRELKPEEAKFLAGACGAAIAAGRGPALLRAGAACLCFFHAVLAVLWGPGGTCTGGFCW
jgi:hypothetical protein